MSKSIKTLLLNQGADDKRVYTLYNPINILKIRSLGNLDPGIFLPREYIVFVGRLGRVKNLSLLIDSYIVLQNKRPSLELVIVGDGPMLKTLQEDAIRNNISNKIHFLGSQQNPFPIIKKSQAVILTSFSEALPTVILESFTFGKTVISTPTIGALDLLENGRLGYISDTYNNAINFAKDIEKALLFPISKELMKLKVDEFNVSQKANELIKLIED